jgi:hypothetical protein
MKKINSLQKNKLDDSIDLNFVKINLNFFQTSRRKILTR